MFNQLFLITFLVLMSDQTFAGFVHMIGGGVVTQHSYSMDRLSWDGKLEYRADHWLEPKDISSQFSNRDD